MVIGGDGTILRAAEVTHGTSTPLLGVNLGHVGFLAEAESEDVEKMIELVVGRRYTSEERLTLDVLVYRDKELVEATLGAQRGQRREGGPPADARGGRRGRRPAAEPVRLRRRRVRDADGVDGVQLQRGRPGRVARGRGAADGPDQRPRAVRPPDGGRSELGAGGRGARADRGRRRAVVRRSAHGRPAARAPASRSAADVRRSGWCGCTRRRSPTGSWRSSGCPSRAGVVPGERRRRAGDAECRPGCP